MLEIECDECGNRIDSGERIFCKGCYDELLNTISNLEDDIMIKDGEIEDFEEKISELENEIEELRSRLDGQV